MIEFGNFSSHSFEHFSQAMCLHVFGPGTVVFGAGPDGAREATFEGKVPFPSAADQWNGYIVAQAKCRERLRQNADDTKWLISQLETELSKFTDETRELRAPEYYLLITNVTLSPIAEIGGKAKIDAVFKKYQERLGMRDWHVWGADELRTLLETAPEIRKTYTAWLTPSDVLAQLIDSLSRPNLARLLPLALATDLKTERDVKLRESGQETDKSLYLDSVFVDLPVEVPRSFLGRSYWQDETEEQDDEEEIYEDGDDDSEMRVGIIELIGNRAADKLDPRSCMSNPSTRHATANRVVILGGPGQGKSTIGQFACQIARARLLQRHEPSRLIPETREIIEATLRRAESERIVLSGPCRFPVRVELPAYADAIVEADKQKRPISILTYIAQRLSRELDAEIDSQDLRNWLVTYPWLVVFDGLDEVPPTSNRDAVIKAVERFSQEVHLANADVLAIVTTRPQGYNNALSPKFWQHWHLEPLSVEEAAHYATCLAEVRLPDKERRESILKEITAAFADDTTQALSTSPLQIAIIFGIALLKGAVPHDRWDLFDRYYSLLRDREAQKPTQTAALFRDFKRQIDDLHHRCGFILQVMAETAGGAAAFLTLEQLENVIIQILKEDDFDSKTTLAVAAELRTAATDRLVLLSSRIEGRVAFDVRALQEYMAAAELTSAASIQMVDRLRAISKNPHWRQTLRIACSRIFSVADLSYLRDDMVAICHALDHGDFGDKERLVKLGAKLALELLGDGITATAPKYRKSLLRRALGLVDFGRPFADARLALFFRPDTADIFEEQLAPRMQQPDSLPCEGAWALTLRLAAIAPEWSQKILLANWPDDPSIALRLLGQDDAVLVAIPKQLSALHQRIKTAQFRAGYDATVSFHRRRFSFGTKSSSSIYILPQSYSSLRMTSSERTASVQPRFLGSRVGNVFINQVASADRFKPRNFTSFPSAGWAPIHANLLFAKSPNKKGLAEALRSLGNSGFKSTYFRGPWPLETLVREAYDGLSFSNLADEADAGRFGDHDDWIGAEARWSEKGILASDFETWNGGRYISSHIASSGAPLCSTLLNRSLPRKDILDTLLELVKSLKHPRKAIPLIELAISYLRAPMPGVRIAFEIDELVAFVLRLALSLDRELHDRLGAQLGALDAAWRSPSFLNFARNTDAPIRTMPVGSVDLDKLSSERSIYPHVAASVWRLLNLDVEIPEAMTTLQEGDTPLVQNAVILLALASGRPLPVSIDKAALAVTSFSPPLKSLFLRSRRGKDMTDSLEAELLCEILKESLMTNTGARVSECVELLQANLDRRPSLLADPAEVTRLKLPALL